MAIVGAFVLPLLSFDNGAFSGHGIFSITD